MIFPMESDTITKDRSKLVQISEGLYQHNGSKEYYARFWCRGKRIQQKLGSTEQPCTNLAEARRLFRDLKSSTEHIDPSKFNKTLGTVINEYEAILHCAPKTMVYKKLHLKRLREKFPLPQSTKIRNIQKTDVLKFLSQYNHLVASSWNAILTLTRDVFQHAVEDGVIAHSPAASIVYRQRKDKSKRLIPSFAEFEAIVESVRSQKFADTAKESADLIEFMGLAGLGQAECFDLTWGDINFKTSKVTIIRKKTSKEFSFPIYPALLPLLKRMNKEREDKNATAKVFSVKDPKIALENACKRLNLPNYSARAFRRMFITRALELGIDAQTIASWQGHRDGGQLILKVYARVSEEHTRKMASLMIAPSSESVIPIGSVAA
jgi:integrase